MDRLHGVRGSGYLEEGRRDPIFDRNLNKNDFPTRRFLKDLTQGVTLSTVVALGVILAYEWRSGYDDRASNHYGERIESIPAGLYRVSASDDVGVMEAPEGWVAEVGKLAPGEMIRAEAVTGELYPVNSHDNLAPVDCGDGKCGIWYRFGQYDDAGKIKKAFVRGNFLDRVK